MCLLFDTPHAITIIVYIYGERTRKFHLYGNATMYVCMYVCMIVICTVPKDRTCSKRQVRWFVSAVYDFESCESLEVKL